MTDPMKGSPDRITSTKPRPQRSMDPAVHPDDLGEIDGIRDSLTRLYGIVAELDRRVAVCVPSGDTERRMRMLESAMDAQVRENRVKPSTTEKLGRIEYRLKGGENTVHNILTIVESLVKRVEKLEIDNDSPSGVMRETDR